MKYYLIAGEASGDLHASNLMKALKKEDPEADFRFFGGDLMSAVGGTRVKHYRELAYMGFIPVLMHLPTILSNMKLCKQDIVRWNPDVVILIDYPGFNLDIAKYVKAQRIVYGDYQNVNTSIATALPNDGTLQVYNLHGVQVATSTDNLPAGIYVVRQGDKTYKLMR